MQAIAPDIAIGDVQIAQVECFHSIIYHQAFEEEVIALIELIVHLEI
jgi:hypothetical protein